MAALNVRNLGRAATLSYIVDTHSPMFLSRNFKPDRRRRKRQLLNTSVRVFADKGCLEALGLNISELGMSLFTLANLALGSQIEVEFRLPQASTPTRVCATVRHRALYLYGIEFLRDSDQDSREAEKAQESAVRAQQDNPAGWP